MIAILFLWLAGILFMTGVALIFPALWSSPVEPSASYEKDGVWQNVDADRMDVVCVWGQRPTA